ncbi:hypothetical protein A3D06_01845 [Candidatus Roizmanbacteria bacterium RIFCSPHIGHO2_02_FULL_40_9]|uniref:Uncharacterized protein n=2 Tax=Candidatus Roizmaniibacteriota TaxID=1752723 RepID=A0A1F7INZ1_9BACT|nr:MAG: hypothetical protein A3D06_01845 [Candidatus Roizmanbacteria bacterium RIFCSPHIGHO2_02_FULL_40_9]OGK45079.1 MAG: hypothetical protein A2957_02165 [Candidatus Roizmanbacteria bacterium RIFCSPLOWO2_01_FULL_38_11]
MSLLKKNTGNIFIIIMLQKHIVYIGGLLLFAFLIISFIPLQLKEYVEAQSNLKVLDDNLNQLTIKRSTIFQYNKHNIDDQLALINTILPTTEDKFTIFNAADNLQFVYGMFVDKYSSPYGSMPGAFVSVAVMAQADEVQFMDFLKNYHYLTGRFMTINNIIYIPSSKSLSFTAEFHIYKPNVSSETSISFKRKILEDVEMIRKTLSERNPFFMKASVKDDDVSTEYTTKTNPFR